MTEAVIFGGAMLILALAILAAIYFVVRDEPSCSSATKRVTLPDGDN
jgi:hypothetical protein